MGVGILRLDDGLRIELANTAAHLLLGRTPGSIVGLSTMEAFVDARVEEVVTDGPRHRRRLGRVPGPRQRRPDARRASPPLSGERGPGSSSRTCRSCAASSRSGPSSSTTSRTSCGHRSRRSASSPRRWPATPTAPPRRCRPKMRDRITKIEVETGHLVQMVNELLDLARIESGGPLVLIDDIDIGRVAAESAERLRLFAERQGLRLVVDVPDGLPRVRGDEARIGQVVVNLLHNAVKFSADSGGDVTVRARADDGEVVVSVADHGDRHPEGRPGPDLRALLQGRPGPRPGRRHGPRPVDRPERPAAARRPDLGRIRGRGRVDVLVRAADPRGRRNGTLTAWPRSPSRRSTSATSPTAGTSACRCCSPT